MMEKSPPTFKHMRRILRMVKGARRRAGLAGAGGISLSKTHTYLIVILGEPNSSKRGSKKVVHGWLGLPNQPLLLIFSK
jgi:hypothetical protein